MTKQELIEQRVAQLVEVGYTVDVAQAEAEALYKDYDAEENYVDLPVVEEAPKAARKKKVAE
jgi:hypothetical protein